MTLLLLLASAAACVVCKLIYVREAATFPLEILLLVCADVW